MKQQPAVTTTPAKWQSRDAFSLVELSIVLVIIGLLAGGVLAGKSLIRAAELRAVVSEYHRYVTATVAFRDKYFSLPGDMPNATSFWGQASNCGSMGQVLSGGTCDGNGDGYIAGKDPGTGGSGGAWASNAYENYRGWQQLALAGLIEGSYAGNAGPLHVYRDTVVGWNTPSSKISAAEWCLLAADSDHRFAIDYSNSLHIGSAGGVNGGCSLGVLTPEEAWNIDNKLDEGMPGQGKVIAFPNINCVVASSNPPDYYEYDVPYALTNTNKICTLNFRGAY